MADRLRLAIDAVGGDAGPGPVIEAALRLVEEIDVVLVGPRQPIEAALAGQVRPGLEILDASQAVGMGDDPVAATRVKRDSSLLVAAEAVADGRVDGMVTTGNTGAAVLAAAVRLRRIRGVLTPAMATLLPVPGAGPTVFLDIGATTAGRPEWLAQFALLGAAYAGARLGLDRPRIGLLSNGSEQVKGGPTQRRADDLLARLPGYVGQVESYDLLSDRVDVVVCDGFTGDVTLKMYERTLDTTADVALAAVSATLGPAAAVPVRVAIGAALRAQLAAEPGGVLLGVRGVCVVGHGAADADDIVLAGRVAATCVRRQVTARIASVLSRQC